MAQVSIEKLIKNYLTEVVFCSEHFNMKYYLHLTSSKSKVEESWKKLSEEQFQYDNSHSQSFMEKVEQAYERLKPYIQEGNLKVSENIKALIQKVIGFLKEDIKNINELSEVVLNKEKIISFSNINIERLNTLLDII